MKGHQDDGTPTALNRDAWMNVQMDTLVKSRIKEQTSKPKKEVKIPGEQWSCYIDGKKLQKTWKNNYATT